MRAHQPGSTPIDIPETVPNPAYTPAPGPAPERAPTEPTKVPEKVPEKVIAPKTGVERSAVRVAYLVDPADCPLRPSDRKSRPPACVGIRAVPVGEAMVACLIAGPAWLFPPPRDRATQTRSKRKKQIKNG